MKTETKVIGGIALATLVILVGGILLLTGQSSKEQSKLSKPLMGGEIADLGRGHVPDGNLVHSLEHGAVILSYKSDLSKEDVEKIKSVFSSASVSKKIMVPRDDLDVPVVLTSWGRLLKLQTIDATSETQIKEFMEINEDRGPEKEASV